jgi:hypothetical protein
MPEIGTSGSMSGDGKRSVAEWLKLPRPSSTLPFETCQHVRSAVAVSGKADIEKAALNKGPRNFPIRRPTPYRAAV